MIYELRDLRLLHRPTAGAAQPLRDDYAQDLGPSWASRQAGLLDDPDRRIEPSADLSACNGSLLAEREDEVECVPGRSRMARPSARRQTLKSQSLPNRGQPVSCTEPADRACSTGGSIAS